MFVLGLTGPSGAGKSLAASRLAARGFAVVDADRVAREVMAPGSECLRQLRAAFGAGILVADGSLDRPALARIVFQDAGALRRLDAISHPLIVEAIAARLRELAAGGCRRAVLDAPALYESGADRLCGRVAAVVASPEIRLRRILGRDGITREQAAARIAAQPPREYYTQRADIVIDSDEGTAHLLAETDRLAQKWAG